jgi:hypothetical protein
LKTFGNYWRSLIAIYMLSCSGGPSTAPPASSANSSVNPAGSPLVVTNPVAVRSQEVEPKVEPRLIPPHPLLSRMDWGAEPVGDGCVPHEIVQLSVHHTASLTHQESDSASRIRGYQRFHQQQGWMDLAYHFVIDREGLAYKGRPLGCRGDTFTGYDPSGHFLVVLDGNFEEQEPTDAQLETLVQILAWGAQEYELNPVEIRGHRDHAATLCPGEQLYARIESGELNQRVMDVIQSGPLAIR